MKIQHDAIDAANFVGWNTSSVTAVKIQRRIFGEQNWQEIRNIPIITSDDLTFSMFDYTANSYQVYEYRNVITADTEYIGPVKKIETRFDGILIGNNEKCFVSLLSPKYTQQREFNTAYVKPFNSQYPHVVYNGAANSSKGTVSGFFNPINDDCQIEMKYGPYATEIVDFLSDGTPKFLKTFDGFSWYVQIDTPIKTDYDNVIGLIKIDFSWTEIGKAPAGLGRLMRG